MSSTVANDLQHVDEPAESGSGRRMNSMGQPIGAPVRSWQPPPVPPSEPLEGRYGRLVPLDAAAHGEALHAANSLDAEGRNWTYLANGPFGTFEGYRAWLREVEGGSDPMFYTVLDEKGSPVGMASFMRIAPGAGSIEVGHIHFSRKLQRTRLATEAMYLMMQRAFTLGYRRYEWKCDSLNAPSRRAAQRLGFSYEGIFRQALVYKGRNRDTAWYAVIDSEWPRLREAFERWLDPANFDASGEQRESLSDLTRPVLTNVG